jgi:hypothetical protein
MQAIFDKSLLSGRRPAAALAIACLVAALAAVLWRPGRGPAVTASAVDYARQEHCMEAANLVHDVRWAAACMQLAQQGEGDGIADCELPNGQAGALYALLQQAEQRCVAESRTAAGS